MALRKLEASECRRYAAPEDLRFASTDDVAPVSGVASQSRALSALSLGLELRQPRFHVVVVGPPGSGRTFSARSIAQRIALGRPTPDDLLLLPNPARPSEPTALNLPAGQGRAFVTDMTELYAKLVEGIRGATEGERFKHAQAKSQRRSRSEEAKFEAALKRDARALGLELERSGDEVEVQALAEGEEPTPEALESITGAIEEFESQLAKVHEEAELELRSVVKQLLGDAVKACFSAVVGKYEARDDIRDFLGELEVEVTRRVREMVEEPRGEDAPSLSRGFVVPTLLTEREAGSGAPVVEVAHPTLQSLFGRSYSPPDSAFPPDPGFAVAGALHQANGGFLILPASALLKNEALYEQLKACLLAEKFIVPEQNPSYYRGAAEELLFPSIPIDVKVILVAGPSLFQELHAADPEFSQLFKVQARFEPTLPRGEAMVTYPSFLAGLVKRRNLLPLTRDAVAELVFQGGRLAESQTKVTSRLGLIAEIATEASYVATRKSRDNVDAATITEALANAERRGSQFRDAIHELLTDGTIRIETRGHSIGQVNAISVLSDGPVTFGRPCRVTAVVYPGQEGPVNIAREVEMSGPIHAKGVLVLTGYLASRFAQTHPLSFSASLVFEQTYEAIDGDSASSSELYALISALSGLPLRQDLAVTGSVDQRGSIQPVGGLNEKIEAFYDVCVAKGGLTGTQGVLIPATNVDALMLRADVTEAIRTNMFHVYALNTVEEGIELLTSANPGGAAGPPYPEGSVFARVEARLKRFYEVISKTPQTHHVAHRPVVHDEGDQASPLSEGHGAPAARSMLRRRRVKFR
ncbi:MAG: AAA family ATPase [Polyangiaceae bacterium]